MKKTILYIIYWLFAITIRGDVYCKISKRIDKDSMISVEYKRSSTGRIMLPSGDSLFLVNNFKQDNNGQNLNFRNYTGSTLIVNSDTIRKIFQLDSTIVAKIGLIKYPMAFDTAEIDNPKDQIIWRASNGAYDYYVLTAYIKGCGTTLCGLKGVYILGYFKNQLATVSRFGLNSNQSQISNLHVTDIGSLEVTIEDFSKNQYLIKIGKQIDVNPRKMKYILGIL
jgi:hypothetical protein